MAETKKPTNVSSKGHELTRKIISSQKLLFIQLLKNHRKIRAANFTEIHEKMIYESVVLKWSSSIVEYTWPSLLSHSRALSTSF